MFESLNGRVVSRLRCDKNDMPLILSKQEDPLFQNALKNNALGPLIGKSKALQDVFRAIIKFSKGNGNVIIYGESGTGKELVARTLHELGPRKDGAFVPVNCGAIPCELLESEFYGHKKGAFTGAVDDKEGYLGLADKGTLFFDEVGELETILQVKLLRAIDGCGYTQIGGKEVIYPNVRIIAATNQNMCERGRNKMIREDFFYRIHVLPIHIPPLRKHKEDLPLLIDYFLSCCGRSKTTKGMPADAMKKLLNHDWPGNIRELRNTILRYVTLNEIQFLYPGESANYPAASIGTLSGGDTRRDLKSALEEFESQYILKSLEINDWHQTKTADFLKINRKTLYQKIQHYGIQRTHSSGNNRAG